LNIAAQLDHHIIRRTTIC